MNRFKIIGLALIATSVMDVGMALALLPPSVQWVLFLVAATSSGIGVYFLFRGINQDQQ